MSMRISSYEYFDKYRSAKRIKTSPGIDQDVPILFGRTIKELLFSITIFVIFSWFNKPFSGAFVSSFFYIFAPFYRNKVDPAFFSHIAWSFGLRKKFFDKNKVPHFFSYSKYILNFGP